jgi:hypothetical protein
VTVWKDKFSFSSTKPYNTIVTGLLPAHPFFVQAYRDRSAVLILAAAQRLVSTLQGAIVAKTR